MLDSRFSGVDPRESERDQAAAFLRLNNRYYESLLRHIATLHPEREPETLAQCLGLAAFFASTRHCGRFADGALENFGLELAARLETSASRYDRRSCEFTSFSPARSAKRHVLHVSTAVHPTGGHTRTILKWLANDPDTCHSLLLTRQGDTPIAPWISGPIRDNGGTLVVLPPDAPLLAKSLWLRRAAQSSVDLIVLQQFPDDIVPVIACGTPSCPPVAVLNHADHVFWLGGTIADAVINHRQVARDVSEARRFTRRNLTLPVPLDGALSVGSRADARRELNIPDSAMVLLSVGRERKYVPTRTRNFYRAALAILEANPGAHLYLVGVSWNAALDYLRDARHERLHFVGSIEDPSVFQRAADVYLEGFPFGSQTALLESVLAGGAPVRALAPHSELLVTNDIALSGLAVAVSEQEYIERATSLIRDVAERKRLALEIGTRVRDYHTGPGWRARLEIVYAALDGVNHEPRRMPAAACLATDADVAIGAWHAGHYEGADGDRKYADSLTDDVSETARIVRNGDNYRGALRLLRLGIRLLGYKRHLVLAMAKLPVHWIYQRGRPTAMKITQAAASLHRMNVFTARSVSTCRQTPEGDRAAPMP